MTFQDFLLAEHGEHSLLSLNIHSRAVARTGQGGYGPPVFLSFILKVKLVK